MTRNTGKLADPEWRRQRAKKASDAAHSVDAHIKALVTAAPKLTPDQRARLAEVLRPQT